MEPRSHSAPARPRAARRGRRLLASAVAASALLGAAACGDSGPEDPSTGAGGSSVAADDQSLEPEATVDPGPAPVVEVLDAGASERRVLSYGPSREPATVEVSQSGTARTEVPGAQTRVDQTPAQTLTLEGRSEPDVDGAQRAAVTVREFTSTDELRAAQFSTAPGFTATWTRSADGSIRELGLAAPVDASDAARAAVEIAANAISDATVVFPTEAIGEGARWTATRQVDDAVASTRVVTYELVELDGDLATVRTETTAPDAADTLTAPAPDGGPGVTLDVETYDITGSGELTVDLRAALPVDGKTESSTRAVYVDPETGQRTTFDENSVLEFRSVG
ncbi:hypothetical protein ACWGLC_08705 [Dietzia sp. NPDC055877]